MKDTQTNSHHSESAPVTSPGNARWLVIAGAIVIVFAAAYAFAAGRGPAPSGGTGYSASGSAVQGKGRAAGGLKPACACCGSAAPTANGVTGPEAKGAAALEGAVQKISIDVSKGYYEPNTIVLKAGVPAEVTFGQSSGCTAQVISADLGFSEDLTAGPRTVKLPALAKGAYAFSCGMQMVFGKIIVE